MNKIFTLAFVLFATAFPVVAQNMVTNSGFDTWTVNDPLTNMPASWARGAGTVGTHYLYATDPVQGNILRLKDNVGNAGAKRFNTTADFSVLTEGTYRVSFKVKGDVGLRFVALVKGTTAPSSAAQSATNHFTNITGYTSPTVVSDWTTVETDIEVPSTATFGEDYRLHISWSHSTTTLYCDFYIDDIMLVKAPGTTTSVDNQTVSAPAIFGVNGKVHFNTLENVAYTVVSLNGSKVTEGIAAAGSSIDLPRGAYVVKTQQKAYKVVL